MNGHRHRAGGDAAGIEGHRKELLRHEPREQENEDVDPDQQVGELDAQQHTQHGDDQKNAHPDRHGDDQDHIGDARDLLGQHLEVGLGHGDEDAHEQAHKDDQPHPARLGDGGPHVAADRGHGQVGAQGEEPHPQNQQKRPEHKAHQQAVGNGGDGKAEQEDDPRHRQDGGEGFLQLLGKNRSVLFQQRELRFTHIIPFLSLVATRPAGIRGRMAAPTIFLWFIITYLFGG